MDHTNSAPNYTTASLILGLINLLWIFGALWAAYGLIPVLVAGAAINHLINRIAAIRASRAIVWPRPDGTPTP